MASVFAFMYDCLETLQIEHFNSFRRALQSGQIGSGGGGGGGKGVCVMVCVYSPHDTAIFACPLRVCVHENWVETGGGGALFFPESNYR